MSEEQKADERMEQIISEIKARDKEALKSLFSEKAIDESDDFDGGVDSLFDFILGDIVSWERDSWASDESIRNGKKSLMIRFAINVNTDKYTYRFSLSIITRILLILIMKAFTCWKLDWQILIT